MLDSRGAAVLEGAMAETMIPPAAAPEFLARNGWGGADIVPLAGDASFRRYFRVVAPGRQAVLMDAPPPHEDPRPFIRIAEHLTGLGFSAPGILASDLDCGLVLLEDFGDARMREVVDAAPESELAIYADVVTLLARLHQYPAADLPPYSRSELQREVGLFTQWYCPAVSLAVDETGYRSAWDAAFDAIGDGPTVTVLRDYHAENIMLIDGRAGLAGLGLLDFQDALAGHPAYDLVSLLQDARRDVSPLVVAEMRALYAGMTNAGDAFDAAYAILGAQRNVKILGIFTRLWKRDGKPRYLHYLARVWGYVERDLQHPALVDIADWFGANVPSEYRAAAWAHLPV
jgi:aminoglycoside/choline kinase family phosphotransferase